MGMRQAPIALLLTLGCFSFSAIAAENCSIQDGSPVDGKYIVVDESGSEMGYVKQNPDGSWFIWRDQLGADNSAAPSLEAAVDAVCNRPDQGD